MRKPQLRAMEKEINTVLKEAKAMAFVQVVRRHKDATLGDLMELAVRMELSHLNIGQILFNGLPKSGKEWANKVRAIGPGGAYYKPADTRHAKSRQSYDSSILTALERRRDWWAAIDIRKIVGGTPDQARRSLNRLIESGHVRFKGKARATVYQAV